MKSIQNPIILEAENFLEKTYLPSVSIYIEKEGKILFNDAFGYSNIYKNKKATPSTFYNLGSMLKLMTASCIGILKDRGALDFHQKISEFLPTDLFEDKRVLERTVHQLLTHTAGLPLGFVNSPHLKNDLPPVSFLSQVVRNIKPENAFGHEISYSNYGYAILGLIIETISQQKFEEFLAEHILKPLGFENHNPISIYNIPNIDIATPYVTQKNQNLELQPIRLDNFPAGEGYFTLQDYAKFIRMHMNEGQHNGKTIIKGETIREMHQLKNSKLEDSCFGYGCIVLPDEEINIEEEKYGQGIFHTGGVSGYSCSFTTNTKGNYFILIAINSLWQFDDMYPFRDFCMKELQGV